MAPPMPCEALLSGLRLDHPFTVYNFPAQALAWSPILFIC
jgi:hypothetical protein